MSQNAVTVRERLLGAASRLFYAEGMTATGIDSITSAAGVAKMSFYNNFSSKEEFVHAYIEARHEEWLQLYQARAEHVESAVDGVLAVFDAYIDHASASYVHGFRGCGLLNAAAELPTGAPGREAVRRHKEQVEEILTGHLLKVVAKPLAAREAAEHLTFLLEGAMSRAGLEGRPDRLVHARKIAIVVVEAL
jgi:AcrR family transcriptional regulator